MTGATAGRTGGFTLMEMAIAMAIVGLFVALATPGIERFVIRARESALREDLNVMRRSIDAYYADHRRYPDSLEDLVSERYFRSIPTDPFTRSTETWILIRDDDGTGIFDIHSGTDLVGLDGEPYNAW